MNIKEAKEEIKRTLRAYTAKTDSGQLFIPPVQQRPVLLIGPPGIGKSAIMTQIAHEEGVGLVSYTMTHHTRQSAIGLPTLKEETFQGRSYTVTEYTMSEIVASVYQCMKRSSCSSGILFIDEMNCVSETLAPVMLQLLQNKTFGSHPLPEGWLIVAAGNPPEYNRSVREFDMVTLDRVKHIRIEADYDIWKEYARQKGLHPAVLAYLNMYPDDFYRVDRREGTLSFVTARGWEDLSCILTAYERVGDPVTEALMLQYLQQERIARNFSLFYDSFQSYTEDFARDDCFSETVCARIRQAEPAEAIAIASMLFARTLRSIRTHQFHEQIHRRFHELCEQYISLEARSQLEGESPLLRLDAFLSGCRRAVLVKEDHDLLSPEERILEEQALRLLEEQRNQAGKQHLREAASIRALLLACIETHKKSQELLAAEVLTFLNDSYALLENAPAGTGLLYLTSDLAGNTDCVTFLSSHPCPPYQAASGQLLLRQREDTARRALEQAYGH